MFTEVSLSPTCQQSHLGKSLPVSPVHWVVPVEQGLPGSPYGHPHDLPVLQEVDTEPFPGRRQLQVLLQQVKARDAGEEPVHHAVDNPAVPEVEAGHQPDVVDGDDAVIPDQNGRTTTRYFLQA